MCADTVTRVTRESWGSRLGGAIRGVVFGLLLFVVAFPLLFWNEGRAVKSFKTLQEGAGAVVSVAADAVDPAQEGQLVHFSGTTATPDTLVDPDFGVSANAIRLDRTVEMYQWKETEESKTEKNVGGSTTTTTTYRYSKDWSSSPIDSAGFEEPTGHQNPGSFPYVSLTKTAATVTLGAFTLTESFVSQLSDEAPLAVDTNTPVPAALAGRGRHFGGGFYVGDPASPQVGDLRITFQVVRPAPVSVVGGQSGSTLVPHRASTGGTIALVESGTVDAASMFALAQQRNRILTWILRFAGFLLMFVGLSMVFKPLSVLADVLPFLGSLIGAGTGLVAGLVAACCSLLTVAIAWLVFRPLLGGVLLVAAMAIGVLLARTLRAAARRA